MAKHNHLAVWSMIIFQMLLGYIWYTHLFAETWFAHQTRTLDQMSAAGPSPFIYSIMGAIFSAYTISWLVQATNTLTFMHALMLSLLLCLGFVFPSLAVHYKFLGISGVVLLLDMLSTCISIIATTCVLALWRAK